MAHHTVNSDKRTGLHEAVGGRVRGGGIFSPVMEVLLIYSSAEMKICLIDTDESYYGRDLLAQSSVIGIICYAQFELALFYMD